MTLEEYVKALNLMLKENPEFGKLTVAYSTDDEGNSYSPVITNGTPAKVEDPEDRHIKLIGYWNGDDFNVDGVKKEEVNCIIIN